MERSSLMNDFRREVGLRKVEQKDGVVLSLMFRNLILGIVCGGWRAMGRSVIAHFKGVKTKKLSEIQIGRVDELASEDLRMDAVNLRCRI